MSAKEVTVKVSEVMTTELVTVRAGAPLKEAAELMLKRRVSGLPVVDGDGTLVGIITEADFVDQEAVHAWSYRRSLLAPLFGGGKTLSSSQLVSDAMSEKVTTIRGDIPLAAAARQMATEKVKRLPVVDAAGRLIGIVSRADVLKAFVRDDKQIVSEIDRLLAGRALPIDPSAIEVKVDDGIVTVAGAVDARVDAEVLIEFIEHVDGVVNVHSTLTWQVDDRRAAPPWAPFPQEGADR